MKSFLQELRETTAHAEAERIEAAARAQREIEAAKRAKLDQVEREVREIMWPKVMAAMRAAAQKGERRYTIPVLSLSRVSTTPEAERKLDTLRDLLTSEALAFEVERDRTDPVGSNSHVPYTVYNIDLLVEW